MPKKKPKPKRKRTTRSPAGSVSLRQSDSQWILVHPSCTRERAEDLDEVRTMIEAEEYEVAAEELRWLLGGCAEFVEAHLLSGQIAVANGPDLPLARGHFGYAWQLGLKAWRKAGKPRPVPYSHPANKPWYESGTGLAWCLEKMGKGKLADEIVGDLRKLDASDPTGVAALLDDLRSGGLPMLEL